LSIAKSDLEGVRILIDCRVRRIKLDPVGQSPDLWAKILLQATQRHRALLDRILPTTRLCGES